VRLDPSLSVNLSAEPQPFTGRYACGSSAGDMTELRLECGQMATQNSFASEMSPVSSSPAFSGLGERKETQKELWP
jgi:hypothetical protein